MKMSDRRSKRIVFVSPCILDQNIRFPGIAVEAGACTELVKMLMGHGLGIETLPCLECLVWGGVSRRNYFRYQPLLLRFADTRLSWFFRIAARLWIIRYGLRCSREAGKTAGRIRDLVREGYSVVGVIGMNDSPTDGVTRTINLINAPGKFRALGFNEEILQCPDISLMKSIIPNLCEPGPGIFISRLAKQLERGGVRIKFAGFDPWADPAVECLGIGQALGLL